MIKNELILRKTNDLIQNFSFDLQNSLEMDIFDFMIANIKSPMYDTEFNLLDFTLVEFYRYSYGRTPGGDDYFKFKKAVEMLASRQSWGVVKEGKYKNFETIMRLIDEPYLNPDTHQVILKLDDNLKPYLLDFANKPHTRILYITKAALSKKYTKRLYEILKSNENMAHGVWPSGMNYIPIEQFKELLYIPESYKPANIKKRVLLPAQVEIEEKTDIKFSYREIKEGKGVIGYQFKILKQEGKIDKAPPPPKKKKEIKVSEPDIEVKEYPSYITTLLESINATGEDAGMLLAMIEEYLVLLHDKPNDDQKTVYVYSLISKVRRARKINTSKLAYAEGIVRNELDKLKTSKVSAGKQKPVVERKLPDWFEKQQNGEEEVFEEADPQEIEEFKKKLEELEEPFKVRKEKLQAKLKEKYGKGRQND